MSTSLNRVGRSTTTPFPITGITWSYSTPDGTSCSGVLLACDHHRVPGVVPALVAHHVGVLLGEEVDDFGFAFVAPLGADDDGDGHARSCAIRWLERVRTLVGAGRCASRPILRTDRNRYDRSGSAWSPADDVVGEVLGALVLVRLRVRLADALVE